MVVGEGAAPEATIRAVQDRLVPFPHVAALVERVVRALGQLELARLRPVVRTADGVAALVEVGVVAVVGSDPIVARRAVAAGLRRGSGLWDNRRSQFCHRPDRCLRGFYDLVLPVCWSDYGYLSWNRGLLSDRLLPAKSY